MEGRRITASPRPCSGRRVAAKKRSRPDGFVNSVKKLQRREISSRKDRAFSISTAQERFRNMRLVVCLQSFAFALIYIILVNLLTNPRYCFPVAYHFPKFSETRFSTKLSCFRGLNFAFQEQYDTHDPKGHCLVALPFLMKRTKVIEIVAARDIVFALAHSGVCAAFSRGNFA